MPDLPLSIEPTTKVADLLDAYPELEEPLIAMAPPFEKLRNPVLRRSVARIATLRQAAAAAGLDLVTVVDALRAEVGQPPLSDPEVDADQEGGERAAYFGTEPEWFTQKCVTARLDDRDGDGSSMAITRVLAALRAAGEREPVELTTTFLPAPGIDAARAKGLTTWTVRVDDALYRTYFTR